MSIYDDLKKLDHVKNHPLIKNSEKNRKESSERVRKHSQELNDDFNTEMSEVDYSSIPEFLDESAYYGYVKNSRKDLNTMLREAYEVVRDTLSCFNLPVKPTITYNNVKNVKFAKDDEDKVVSANILFNVEVRSLTGSLNSCVMSIPVSRGILLDPTQVEVGGTVRVISQSTFDDLVGRGTTYKKDSILDNMFAPPLTAEERIEAIELRDSQGYKPVDNTTSYYLGKKESREKPIPEAYKLVKKDLEKAEKDGTDSFPRKWEYVYMTYILKHVSEADKDAWMPHLVNAGFVINPLDVNRGRKTGQDLNSPNEVGKSQEMELDPSGKAGDNYYYRGTVAPIEAKDQVKFQGHEGPIHGTIQSITPEGIASVKSNKGYVYEVPAKDIVPLPSTLKKMYVIGSDKQAQEFGNSGGPNTNIPLMNTEPSTVAEQRYYNGTVMPIEADDRVKFNTGKDYIRGLVSDVGADEWVYVVDPKNLTYRVHHEDVEALPSTYKKMWMQKDGPVEDVMEDSLEDESLDIDMEI